MEPILISRYKKNWRIWTTALVFIAVSLVIFIVGIQTLNKKTIYGNIYIESVNVSYLTKEEAYEKVHAFFQEEISNRRIKLTFKDDKWSFPYEDLGYQYKYNEAIEKAYSIGREGRIISRFLDILSLRKRSVHIPLDYTYNEEDLMRIVLFTKEEIEREAIDASISRESGKFNIIPEMDGYTVDETALLVKIREGIQQFSEEEIEIPITRIQASITKKDLEKIKNVLGEFNTSFDSSIRGRSENIRLASSRINGILLMPNDVFSFTERIGTIGVEEGFQEAPVIVNGRLVPGIGGGICQVSSTLYIAVVKADLEVIERRNHSLPVSYVPMGQDATIATGHIDLRFLNNKEYPIYIESYVDGGRVYVIIHGNKTDDTIITIVSEVVRTIEPTIEIRRDPNLKVGVRIVEREAKRGYVVNTFKVYMLNGKEIKREEISRDYYRPVNGLVVEGGMVDLKANEAIEDSEHEDPFDDEGEES